MSSALQHIRSKYIYLAIFLAIFLTSISIAQPYRTAQSRMRNIWLAATTKSITQPDIMSPSLNSNNPSRLPIYFLGIGGPNFIKNTKHPAYFKLAEVGKEITTKVKPKAVVVISAHWQAGPNKIQINVAEQTDIIYDFYGFPPNYYEIKYPNKGSPVIAERVIEKLGGAGIEVEKVKRGLDHGVWVGFLAAFDPEKNPLNVPVVQFSLFSGEDVGQHYRMGQALESLRDEGILIIAAGMTVHNLRDFRAAITAGKTGVTMPYASTFDDALADAAAANPEDRQEKMVALMRRNDARQAHPTWDHILPIHVAAGAAGEDVGERLWTLPEGSLNWAQYRFGKVAT